MDCVQIGEVVLYCGALVYTRLDLPHGMLASFNVYSTRKRLAVVALML